MTLTAIIGALMAVVARPAQPDDRTRRLALKVLDLSQRFEQLQRSRAQLVNHIELIERQLDMERRMCAHWRETAMRIARQSREAREERDRLRQPRFHPLGQQMASQGYCNCVPARAQVWGSNHGLVQELNALGQ